MKKIIGISAVVLALTMLAVNVLANDGTDVTASVTVPIICGYTVTGTLDFTNTLPGGSSDIKDLTLTNTGSIPIIITVYGIDWSDNSHTMPVGQTMYGNPSPSTALESSPGDPLPEIENLPSNTLIEYFQMSVPWGQAAGDYEQTVTFTGCE